MTNETLEMEFYGPVLQRAEGRPRGEHSRSSVIRRVGDLMKRVALFLLLLSFARPDNALACGGPEKPTIFRVKQFVPYAGTSVKHWPAEYDIPIISVVAFLVPRGTKFTLKALVKDTSEPVRFIRSKGTRIKGDNLAYIDREEVVDYDEEKYEWIYFQSASYGKSEIVFEGPGEWSRTMTIGVVYPPAWESRGRPAKEVRLESGEPAGVAVDGRDDIQLSLPGAMTDHWSLDSEQLGFRITRVEEQKVPHKDAERVRIFLEGSSSPKSGELRIRRERKSAKPATFRLSITALPTPFCSE